MGFFRIADLLRALSTLFVSSRTDSSMSDEEFRSTPERMIKRSDNSPAFKVWLNSSSEIYFRSNRASKEGTASRLTLSSTWPFTPLTSVYSGLLLLSFYQCVTTSNDFHFAVAVCCRYRLFRETLHLLNVKGIPGFTANRSVLNTGADILIDIEWRFPDSNPSLSDFMRATSRKSCGLD